MPEKEYLILLDLDVRKRHFHQTKAGRITKFVAQLEIKIFGEWKEVIRYDCAHDFAHKDRYHKSVAENKKVATDFTDYFFDGIKLHGFV